MGAARKFNVRAPRIATRGPWTLRAALIPGYRAAESVTAGAAVSPPWSLPTYRHTR